MFPRGSPQDAGSFLNLRIDRFEVEDELGMFVSHRLRQRLRPIVGAPNLPPGAGEAGSIASGNGDRPISIKLENVTVRNILDEISVRADRKVWVVAYPENATVTPRGFYRTVSIHAGFVPDEHQPVWAFLSWGYDPIAQGFRVDWKRQVPVRTR